MGLRDQFALLKPVTARGKFPSLQWAWPTGARDLLIRAAVLPDLREATAAFDEWQRTVEFESATMAEQRLLVAISYRMPEGILPAKDRARLTGVERKLWALSRVALRESAPAFATLEAAGIDVMVLKGAAKAVADMGDLRGRFASDVDVLVWPKDFVRAVERLRADGWEYLNVIPKRIGDEAGINLMLGPHGQVDVHQFPHHQLAAMDYAPDALWQRATRHAFLGHEVFLPSATDRLLMALSHGGIDGHGHSDWLVDAAHLIAAGKIDWPLFEDLCAERRVEAVVAIGLSYLAGPLKVEVPAGVVARLEKRARRRPLQLAATLIEARPKRDHTPPSALARLVARISRMVGTKLRLIQLRRLVEAAQRR